MWRIKDSSTASGRDASPTFFPVRRKSAEQPLWGIFRDEDGVGR